MNSQQQRLQAWQFARLGFNGAVCCVHCKRLGWKACSHPSDGDDAKVNSALHQIDTFSKQCAKKPCRGKNHGEVRLPEAASNLQQIMGYLPVIEPDDVCGPDLHHTASPVQHRSAVTSMMLLGMPSKP